jgi:hypothetical protein
VRRAIASGFDERLEESVHAAMRKYKVDSDQLGEFSKRVSDSFVPRITDAPGFAGYYLIDAGNGILISFTLGEDPDAVASTMDTAVDFVTNELGDLEVERVEAAHGDVTVSRAA